MSENKFQVGDIVGYKSLLLKDVLEFEVVGFERGHIKAHIRGGNSEHDVGRYPPRMFFLISSKDPFSPFHQLDLKAL